MDKAVFLTGAAGGIGIPLTQALLARGITVYAGVRGAAPAGLAGAVPVTVDVTDTDSVAAAAAEVGRRQGGRGLHAVINNAGVIVQGPLEIMPESELHRAFEINLHGAVRVMQAFLPQLRAGHGRIVNISAPAARVAIPFAAPMAASKAALASISDAARIELAPWAIPVIQVEPGGSQTEIFAKAAQASDRALSVADPVGLHRYRPAMAAFAEAGAKQRLDPVSTAVDGIVAAVLDRRPKSHYVLGNARIFAILARLPQRTRDRLVARNLGLAKLTPGKA